MRSPAILFLLLAACATPGNDTGDPGDTATTDTGPGCRAGTPDPGGTRYGLVSHPYTPSGGQADAWEVVALAPDGTVSLPGTFVTMGRATEGTVRFSPDGSLGITIQDDGSIGVFTFGADGTISVADPHFADDGAGGTFYATDAWIDPSGERAYVVDGDWRDGGGGLYEVDLDCATGTPTAGGLVAPSKLGAHLLPTADGRAIYVAADVLDGTGDDAYLLDLDGPSVLGGVPLWPDDQAITGGAAMGGDGSYLLVGDNSAFSDVSNRVGIAHLDGDALSFVQIVTPLEDPGAIGTWGAATLVASGFGDALYGLSFDAENDPPFALDGELTYAGSSPQIPSSITVVPGPDGDGWMLVAEVSAIRVVRASPDGTLIDQGPFDFGSGLDHIVGALGVQPWR